MHKIRVDVRSRCFYLYILHTVGFLFSFCCIYFIIFFHIARICWYFIKRKRRQWKIRTFRRKKGGKYAKFSNLQGKFLWIQLSSFRRMWFSHSEFRVFFHVSKGRRLENWRFFLVYVLIFGRTLSCDNLKKNVRKWGKSILRYMTCG